MLQADHLAGRGCGLRSRLESGARPDKQADLDPLALADAPHLLDVSLAEQQDAAALAYAVDGHLVLLRGLEHGAEHARSFDAGDLEPVLPAVRKALLRGLERVVILSGKFELAEELLSLFHSLLLEIQSQSCVGVRGPLPVVRGNGRPSAVSYQRSAVPGTRREREGSLKADG